MASKVLHLNGFEELNNLIGYLHIDRNHLKVERKKKISEEGPVLVDGSHTILGIITVAKSLARESSKKYLLGENELEQSEVDQWLYFCLSNIATADSLNFKNVLKDLNRYLELRTYITGYNLTLADILLYIYIHKEYKSISFSEKENYMNVSRWFNQVQHVPHLQQKLQNVLFHRTKLY